jgi:hypothetical protein
LRGDRNRWAVSMRPASSVAGRRATSRAPRRRTITVSCWSTTRSRTLARFSRRLVYVVSLGMKHPIDIVQYSCTEAEADHSLRHKLVRCARICSPTRWKLVGGFRRLRAHGPPGERGHGDGSVPRGRCRVGSLRRFPTEPGSGSPALDRESGCSRRGGNQRGGVHHTHRGGTGRYWDEMPCADSALPKSI